MQNYILLASRQLIIAFLSIFTSGLLYRAFGEELFGVYGYFLGIFVILFSTSSASSIVIQRWVSIAHQNTNKDLYIQIKNTSAFYYKLTILLFSLMLFTLIYFYTKGEIRTVPINYSLNIVFILTVIFSYQLFNSLIISFQKIAISTANFVYLAVISTLDALMKFIFALIVFISIKNEIVSFYAYLSLLLITSALMCLIWIYYLKKNILPRKIKLSNDPKPEHKEYSKFAFWSIISSISAYLPLHGMLVVFGSFSSILYVAAFTLSIQLFVAINTISTSIMSAAVPDLTGKFQHLNIKEKKNYIRKSYSFAIGIGLLFWLLASLNQKWFTSLWVGDNTNINNFFIPLSIMGFILITDRVSSLILQGYNAQKNYSIFSLIFLTISILSSVYFLKLTYLNVFEVMYIIALALWLISIYKLIEVLRYSKIIKRYNYILIYIASTIIAIMFLYFVNYYFNLSLIISIMVTVFTCIMFSILYFLTRKKVA